MIQLKRTPILALVAGLVAPLAFVLPQTVHAEGQWVTAPNIDGNTPVVLHFRHDLDLATLPKVFPVKVSADNRFILYVNDKRVGAGPARGDMAHWRYETFDLKPYLHKGHNVVAAEVWNALKDPAKPGLKAAPMAQISAKTGFWLETGSAPINIDSGPAWRVSVQAGHGFTSPYVSMLKTLKGVWYAAGGSETVDGTKADWGWAGPTETPAEWHDSVAAVAPGATMPWTLEPDVLPQMAYSETPAGKVVRADLAIAHHFPDHAVTIPANSETTLLIDQSVVLSAYPELSVSGGKDAKITLTYSEALYDVKALKGDRNAVDDRRALGLEDTFNPDGSADRTFRPLWWRTWRYLQIKVKTGNEALTLNRLKVFETGYPFAQKAYFKSDDTQLNRIWDIGWRTLKVDAHETYMDSSYWEQLQYVGDARIEAEVADTVSGDDRLTRQAIEAFGNSQRADGMIQSAYPSNGSNIIPTFGLLWIGMMHDYWLRDPDISVLRRNLPKARKVLDWYAPYVAQNGLLTRNPEWNFIDWVNDPPLARDKFPSFDKATGTSCLTSLVYLGALKNAADLETALGDPARATDAISKANALTNAIRTACWDATRGLFADDPSLTLFSQHTNALAVLYDVAPREQMQAILDKVAPGPGIDAPADILEASYYFSWYLIQAHEHAGLGGRYFELLQTWRELEAQHFTTWPEQRGNTRSDTHAWSAHPTSDLLAIVAGIQPLTPGYGSVRVAPHLGPLNALDAAAMTPKGAVRLRYVKRAGRLRFTVDLPDGLKGQFLWGGQAYPLNSGANHFDFAPGAEAAL